MRSFQFLCLMAITTYVMLSSHVYAQLPSVETLPDREGLPQALKMEDGTPITSAQQWNEKRRPELKQLFQQAMFGFLPAPPDHVLYTTAAKGSICNHKGILFEYLLTLPDHAASSDGQVKHALLSLIIPANATKPAPVFLALNKCGNHEILPDENITFQEKKIRHGGCRTTQRGEKKDYWSLETLLDRGYGFATCHVADFEFDAANDQTASKKQTEAGTLATWAWGLHRCVDVLSQQAEVDASKICLIGHSRRGKAALFAAAMDERIALVVPHQSGTGGMALSRDNNQETVTRITTIFPHWFSKRFAEYAGNEQKLPIDQHLLMALVAPRPLMETSGLQDTWANFEHSLKGIQEASKVYEFLGTTGIKAGGMIIGPEKLTPENVGHLVQYRLDTKHVLTKEYWDGILDFADIHLAD